jgi:hypothetical protein
MISVRLEVVWLSTCGSVSKNLNLPLKQDPLDGRGRRPISHFPHLEKVHVRPFPLKQLAMTHWIRRNPIASPFLAKAQPFSLT